MLVEAFRQLPQRVLWKYEGSDLDLPPNVLTRKWIPQQDILGHKRTRVFISHCGNQGTQEALYHGVPVLAMPVAFDQPRNAVRLASKGYGLILNWHNLSVETILQAINTLINDPAYQERLTKVSQTLQDQKESAGERAVWWVEYAIRQKGSPHLLYAGKNLHLLQYQMLDVLLFYLLILAMLTFLSCYSISRFLNYCRSRKVKVE